MPLVATRPKHLDLVLSLLFEPLHVQECELDELVSWKCFDCFYIKCYCMLQCVLISRFWFENFDWFYDMHMKCLIISSCHYVIIFHFWTFRWSLIILVLVQRMLLLFQLIAPEGRVAEGVAGFELCYQHTQLADYVFVMLILSFVNSNSSLLCCWYWVMVLLNE